MLIGILLGSAGCDWRANAPISATLVVHSVTSGSAADLASAQKIITARLNAFRPGFDSLVTSRVEGNSIHFDFHGTPVDERTATILATSPGILRLSLVDNVSDTWISDADIVDAQLTRNGDGALMNVRLSVDAGDRLLKKTSANLGRMLRIAWNGRPVSIAPIRAPFGERFQFTAPMPPEGMLMRAMLQSGRLPIIVESAVYRLQPGRGT